MERLITAIHDTPIIDHHAHPLLNSSAKTKSSLLSITTEARAEALESIPSSIAHIRAVDQLSDALNCPPSWEDVTNAISRESMKPENLWAKRCLRGIETILLDDGLDTANEVYDYSWHNRLTRSSCKRIVRIETVAAKILDKHLRGFDNEGDQIFEEVLEEFEKTIIDAIKDPEVVGFKSVVGYRTGLNLPRASPLDDLKASFLQIIRAQRTERLERFERLDSQLLNSYVVHKTAALIQADKAYHKKPIQFHTGGLGDNSQTLLRSSPSHLQEFIRAYPSIPIVLLHAGYPWTREAGYLASVYSNVYADIGEVFPFVSQDGQEKVVREILELCPSEKLLFSTNGHWFPETYLLAVIQSREAFEKVLVEYVQRKALTVSQAIKVVEDVFFHTSNRLYNLKLKMTSLTIELADRIIKHASPASDLEIIESLMANHPSIKFLRVQFIDYAGIMRLRIIPLKRVYSILQNKGSVFVGLSNACLVLMQNDELLDWLLPNGEYKLQPVFSSLRPGPCEGYASAPGDIRILEKPSLSPCPRVTLSNIQNKARMENLEFLVGFEIEIVFMKRSSDDALKFEPLSGMASHVWSAATPLHDQTITKAMEEIFDTLAVAGIHIEQWHPESSTGQYEFVLPPLPPLEAADTLLHAREVVYTVANRYGWKATLHPSPYPDMLGTGAHAHLSIASSNSEDVYYHFYAGFLKHLRSITAFMYSSKDSYSRVCRPRGEPAGSTWVSWGTQNKTTALRKISGSHWEMKCLDGLANIYLTLAAIIAAGTEGVRMKEEMIWGDCDHDDPSSLSEEQRLELNVTETLPHSLEEALAVLEDDKYMRNALGDLVVSTYVTIKRAELEIMKPMSDEERKNWVIERY